MAKETAGKVAVKSKKMVRLIKEVISEFIEAVKRWGRSVFEKFKFKRFTVTMEGAWIVLYGFRSPGIMLARFRKDSLEEWIVENSKKILKKRHSRASQLGKARATGDEALANMLRSNAVKLSEDLGEIAADIVVKERFPAAKLISQGGGRGTLDLIYRTPSGDILIVEAKGAGGKIGSRLIAPGVRAEQGTVAYLRHILKEMKKRGQTQAAQLIEKELKKPPGKRKLRYFLSETPKLSGTKAMETKISEFLLP